MEDIALARLFQEWVAKQSGLRLTPSGYASWEQIANLTFTGSRIGEQAAELFAKTWTDVDRPAHILAYRKSMLHGLAVLDIPPRYVSGDLFEAWFHTRTPMLTWNHPSVLPGYVLCLPCKEKTRHCIEIRLEADNDSGATAIVHLVAIVILSSPTGLTAVPVVRPMGSQLTMSLESNGIKITPDCDYNIGSLPAADRLIAKLVINSWYTHAFEPELITTDPVKSSGGTGFGRRAKEKRSPIAPTWIGRDFKVQRLPSPATSTESRIPVRPHWRSGHWHTVRHGKGKEETRLQWYRPVYVNA